MASAAQFAANRANAQFSTGPRSGEGKARSARNAIRHGLTSRQLIVREDERADFETLRDALVEELAPQGAVETVTFHELLHAAWNLHRFRRLEAESFTGIADPLCDAGSEAFLGRLARYQVRAQRAYYRALQELRTLQTNRALRGIKLDEKVEPDIPAVADIDELTKQNWMAVDSATPGYENLRVNRSLAVGKVYARNKQRRRPAWVMVRSWACKRNWPG
jgi:hypothetical protein